MRTVAIIQARMGSTRLPGKILNELASRPVLHHVIHRVIGSKSFDEVVVATTDRNIDDIVEVQAGVAGATVVRGDEDDVLSRFGLAAEQSNADVIMRITADCPLIEPHVLARMVERYRKGGVDLVSNCLRRTFPRGLDAELFSRKALDIMLHEAHSVAQREHVTPFLYSNPDRFRIVSHEHHEDLSNYRLTLDTPEDLELLERIFSASVDPYAIELREVIALLRANPDWPQINAHIEQKKI
jgi:spore coat polysaccharide biosynthesis protein SpsF